MHLAVVLHYSPRWTLEKKQVLAGARRLVEDPLKSSIMGTTVAPGKVVLLLVLAASASLFFTSSAAGTTRKFANWPTAERIGATTEDMITSGRQDDEEGAAVRHRMLKVKTNDYGTYDPAPAFEKPPFKLIPN